MKKVSADTITELTAAAAATSAGTPPTAQELIEQIRDSLTARVHALARNMQQARNSSGSKGQKQDNTAFKISHQKALEDLREFEAIVARPPNGFALAPVLYTPIKREHNAKVYSQFGSKVRPEFMRFLAENHAAELAALGVSQQGIERMKRKLDPVDENGRLYDVNIDHIIERYGGGKVSTTSEVDPQMPRGSGPTYLANHFSNLLLIPTQVHNLKNSLNELQRAANTPYGQSKWILMLVPKTDPAHAGYVAQPQSQLPTKPGKLRTQQASALQVAISTAEQVGNIFDNSDGEDDILQPILEDMSVRLSEAFNHASKPNNNYRGFLGFYQGEEFTSLREKAGALPPEKTAELRRTLSWIDNGIEARFNHYASKKSRRDKRQEKKAAPKSIVQDNRQQHVPHRKKLTKKQRRHKR